MRWRLIAVLFVLAGAAAAATGYLLAFAPNTPEYEGARAVKIERQAAFDTVVDLLSSAGILERPGTLRLFGQLTGWGGQVKAGHYELEAGASNYDLLSTLRRGLQTPVRVVVPPGSRPRVVAAVVAREMAFDPQEFLAALKDSSLAAELNTDTLHLFGYMLPETYFFYWLNEPEQVVRKIKEAADAFYEKHRAGDPLGLPLSQEQVFNVASIVEWESAIIDERPRVAGVYLNRLRDEWRLEADPTVQFAVLEREGSKRRLLFRDYEIDHPYNTYRRRGLPPGPVTNPAPSAVRAVLQPESHGYYFFVATGDGGHTFSRTLSEHNRAAQAFYRTMRARRAAAAAASGR